MGAVGGPAAAAAPAAPVGDDGWGEVAVPGSRGGARGQAITAAESAPSPEPTGSGETPAGGPGSELAGEPDSLASAPQAAPLSDEPSAPTAGPPEPHAPSAGPANGGATPPSDASPADAALDARAVVAPAPISVPTGPSARAQEWAPEPDASAIAAEAETSPEAANAASGPAPTAGRDDDPDAAPLATVHRLRPLPEIPEPSPDSPPKTESAGAAEQPLDSAPAHKDDSGSGDQPPSAIPADSRPHRLAPVAWDGPEQTFSDGVPVPEEPGDPEGPADGGPRVGSARLAAAQAAARAAARGGAREHRNDSAPQAPARPVLEDDLPSEDDEDAEEAGVVGLEVVKRLLGATVLEEITVTQEGH
ncbi:hypothetical protein [Actinomyces sp. 432]|uniref:hypothetical protein n=1 Tax=Actinomyces sp. 432 TaxID=2057798 RepID=UPI001379D2E0|nr:hypothetical protein [Actinomyces sp. 432]